MPASVASQEKSAERTSKKAITFHYVGRRLKKERLAKKFGLDDVSTTLNIRKDYVKAIEINDFKALPEEAYATGFVRSYAKLVELDSDQLAHEFKEDYKQEHTNTPEDSTLQVIVPTKKPSGSALLISTVVLIVIFFGWMTGRNEVFQATAQELSEKFMVLLQQKKGDILPEAESVVAEAPAMTIIETNQPPLEMVSETQDTELADETTSPSDSDVALLSPEPLPLFPTETE